MSCVDLPTTYPCDSMQHQIKKKKKNLIWRQRSYCHNLHMRVKITSMLIEFCYYFSSEPGIDTDFPKVQFHRLYYYRLEFSAARAIIYVPMGANGR